MMRPSRQGLLLSCLKVTVRTNPAFYGLLVVAILLLDPVMISHAQHSETVRRRPYLSDYIITHSNDTLVAEIVASPLPATPDDIALWTPTKIVVRSNLSTQEFTARDLRAFCFRDTYYQSIALPPTSGDSGIVRFCRRIFDGYISIFSCPRRDGWTEASTLYLRHDGSLQPAHSFPFPVSLVSKDSPVDSNKGGSSNAYDQLVAAAHAFNRLLAPKTSR